MEKMRQQTRDLRNTIIEKLGIIVPNCITETKGEDGKTRKVINFAMLKQMLSQDITEGDEAYEFTWVGKKASIVEANTPIRKTLRPCVEESVDWDQTQNLYIEGDNLDALKLLQESYLNSVKLIYIDPPYNTGNDWVYRDDFAESSEEYDEKSGVYGNDGECLFKNTDSNGRFHSDWCSMMYSRLMVAKNILSPDGAIFISIDDHEADNLKKMCDEVFGASCFVANISWQRTYSTRNDSKGIVSEVEHILVYSRSQEWSPFKLARTAEMDSIYKNPDNDVEPWTSDNPFAPGGATHQGMVYAIQHPLTGEMIYPVTNRHWCYQQDEMLKIMNGWSPYELKDLHDADRRAEVCGIATDAVRRDVRGIVLAVPLEEAKKQAQEVYKRGQWPKFYFTKGGMGGIRRKTYLSSVGGKLPTNFWPYSDVGHTDEAKKELMALFGGKAPFDTPKPVRLMERILNIAADKDSIVMDFFSGSATMAHAVMKKNAEDGGTRRFIMIQLPEKVSSPDYETICDIGKERIHRAGAKIKEENPLFADDLDIGFRVFKVDSSNMNDIYYSADEYSQGLLEALESNIKEDRSDLDLFFGCVLDWGLPLSLPYKSEKIEECMIHDYNDGDLIACFDEEVPDSVLKTIAKRQPFRAVFCDRSFRDTSDKINADGIFKMYAPDATVKVI